MICAWFVFLINLEMDMNIDEHVVPASGSRTNFSIARSESRGSGRDNVSSRHHRPAEPSLNTLRLTNPEEENVSLFVGLDPICDVARNSGDALRLEGIGSRPDNVQPGNSNIPGRWPNTIQHRAELRASSPIFTHTDEQTNTQTAVKTEPHKKWRK